MQRAGSGAGFGPVRPSRGSAETTALVDIEELHRAAVAKGEWGYEDPISGLMVMTSATLLERGQCCGNGCTHCPFGHMNVRDRSRSRNLVQETVVLRFAPRRRKAETPQTEAYVLFFSGGKDSYLALLRLQEQLRDEPTAKIVLLTSFAAHNGIVGHQQVPFREVIMAQARSLGTDVLAVPLHPGDKYEAQMEAALLLLQTSTGLRVKSLVFGDLHLEDIRDWRIRSLSFGGDLADADMLFPVWQTEYDVLRDSLLASPAEVYICSLGDNCPAEAKDLVRIGARYDGTFVDDLRHRFPEIDAFGECGEFHTVVMLPGMDATEVLDAIRTGMKIPTEDA